MHPNQTGDAHPNRAIALARTLMEESDGLEFEVDPTPFMDSETLMLGFVKLGCEVQPLPRRRFRVVRPPKKKRNGQP